MVGMRKYEVLQMIDKMCYSACTVQCRKDAQLRMCNCTNFFMPNVPEKIKCDVEGIICLNAHLNELSVSKEHYCKVVYILIC